MSSFERRIVRLLVDEARDLVEAGALQAAHARLAEAAETAPDEPDLRVLQAQLALEADALSDALEHARVVLKQGDDGDAHYVAARVYEARGDEVRRREHDVAVLRADATADLRHGAVTRDDLDELEAQATDVLAGLPPRIAEAIAGVPVLLEARPHPGIVEDGFDPRAVGLFEGPIAHSDAIADRPARIVIFYANLLATCRDADEVAEQLEITLLHEIGHALGLDEDEVDALGLG
ncbi:MAG: metallopeptidase family protein [Myxococcota bacterium]